MLSSASFDLPIRNKNFRLHGKCVYKALKAWESTEKTAAPLTHPHTKKTLRIPSHVTPRRRVSFRRVEQHQKEDEEEEKERDGELCVCVCEGRCERREKGMGCGMEMLRQEFLCSSR